MVGLDGQLLMVNRAMSEMLGYDEEELTQRGFQELTHADDLDADLALFDQALAGEIDSYRLRKRYLHADGHVVWGDLSVALVRGPRRAAAALHLADPRRHRAAGERGTAEGGHRGGRARAADARGDLRDGERRAAADRPATAATSG